MTEPTPEEQTEAIIEDFLVERLGRDDQPPGLREAIESRLTERADAILKRGRAQVNQLRARGPRLPPAYYAHEEAPEDALQAVAGGIRTALAMAGKMVDPIPFERGAARDLAPSAAWAIRSEGARVPRPSTRPPRLQWSLPPVPWLESKDAPWPPPEATALVGRHQWRHTDLARCTEPPYTGWVQIALMERQFTFAAHNPKQPRREVLLAIGIETPGRANSQALPFGGSPPVIWSRPHAELWSLDQQQARAMLATRVCPLTRLLQFSEEPGAPDPDRGAGLHPFLLGPCIELVTFLGLRPEAPTLRLCLMDDAGPAIVCRQWHGFLVHDGDYEPLTPAVHGTDLLLRSDLYTKLQTAIGPDRIRVGAALSLSPTQETTDSTEND